MSLSETITRAPIILASNSVARRQLLEGAGVSFESCAALVDERAIEAELEVSGPGEVAEALSRAKALAVSRQRPTALVIGADQTLALGAHIFHKSASRQAARTVLATLRGQTHRLYSGIAVAQAGEILDAHVAVASLSMRGFSDAFLDSYLDQVGDEVTQSVGCYQLEGPGIQLFERIEGDYFTILGLPLLPLLAFLRSIGRLDD
ncbi:MAG: Maf family protein [Ancalomicrobiaceae bacterium]|nr:Maf family protein [Ancalomicrobiaceae bacterium]